MAVTTSSSSTSGFFSLRSPNSVDSSRVSSTHGSSSACGKFDGVAMWFINGVTTAFFASLNRCSCIRIATEEDGDDANDLPLMLNDGNLRQDGVVVACTTSRRRTGKGKKSEAVLVDDD
ncbi:hypothetical protein GLYMA_06G048300v4 [Glycine max]|uniref:Uncharacterized protein n=2 Tax=Glycine subgen. Soja TaxID=1462606 RepID=I1K888_SOYBN|nr:uncharacterized protein LOC100811492 [Glycine max]XP_028234999.1 uncharacterized protein LOC114414787 [Glycine soja]KAG5018443.1 hypothetical protein JHK87_014298 [Glycine soja]KAH1124205.1 hypothetical protein GYH30_014100 [Glycine max]KAH1244537.1 hypothetical protein GmHk_06G015134 [Glycine max]KHN45128.1 hypothetical protein glysoja_031356 [Glycine soja]KRH52129.1 hypothetical protein GLYMA_06G048300v4 [Glycine max]|eukprot:XP_003525954.1 uncharacterized protein LOC100811492 [Glycine max]